MHRIRWVILLLGLLGLTGGARADPVPSGLRMIAPGLFYRDDLALASSGKWQALCPTPNGVELESTAVSIRVVPAPHADATDDAEHEGGRQVEVAGCRDALVLLRIPGLRDGSVLTVALGNLPVPKDTAASLRLVSSISSYSIQAVQRQSEGSVVLMVAHGEDRQAIATIRECCNDTWPAIVWAGDLDRDDKLDLLMNVASHYAGGDLALFLSSAARGGDLMAEVARFSWSSC